MGGRKKGGRVFVGHSLKGFSLSQPREQMVVGTGWLHCVHDQEAEELNMWCSTRFLSKIPLYQSRILAHTMVSPHSGQTLYLSYASLETSPQTHPGLYLLGDSRSSKTDRNGYITPTSRSLTPPWISPFLFICSARK